MGDLLVNVLGIARGNQNRGAQPQMHDRSNSRSWSKSRGHKAWGKGDKHGKKH